MKRRLLLIAAAAVGAMALSACETATPYQPLGVRGTHASGGFYETQIETNRFRVGFRGNSLTSRDRVERYLLYRAADLTVQRGYDWFTAVDRNTERTDRYYSTGFGGYGGYGYGGWGGYWGPRWGFYNRGYGGWGYGGWGDPFFGGRFGYGAGGYDLNQISQYEATAEILMGRGPKPAGDRRAFEARQVIDNLRAGIELPQP